ncbi:MAG: PASTA domain-containing protein, partial [Deltaproteobacteria bacterium]|nr:PASTA domain-containing protein [Deltaproteobacteria bacterium]
MRELVKKKIRVPDVSGLLLDNAEILLRNAGFEKPVVRFAESYQRVNAVLQQDPPRWTIVDNDTPIRLIVSRKSYIRHLPGIYQRGGFADAN